VLSSSGYSSTIFVVVVVCMRVYLRLGGRVRGSCRHCTTMTNYYLNHAWYYYSKFQFRSYYMRASALVQRERTCRWRFVVCLFVGWFVACVSSRDVVIVIMVNTRGLEYHRCFIRKVITASAAAAVIVRRAPTLLNHIYAVIMVMAVVTTMMTTMTRWHFGMSHALRYNYDWTMMTREK